MNEDAYIDYKRYRKQGYSKEAAAKMVGLTVAQIDAEERKSYQGTVGQQKTTFKQHVNNNMVKWYLNVPFNDKEEAKAAAKQNNTRLLWDPKYENPETEKMGCWYVEIAARRGGTVWDPANMRKWQFKFRRLG